MDFWLIRRSRKRQPFPSISWVAATSQNSNKFGLSWKQIPPLMRQWLYDED